MTEKYFKDGTEPTILPHFADTYPSGYPGCNGDCNQGRRCPARAPAEAATEVGADDPYSAPRPWLWLRDLVLIGLASWGLWLVLLGL